MKQPQAHWGAKLYFSLVRDYLRGYKTAAEIREALRTLPADDRLSPETAASPADLVMAAAMCVHERYYHQIARWVAISTDLVPQRSGLIHHLEQFLWGHITAEELHQWATWYASPAWMAYTGRFEDEDMAYLCLEKFPVLPLFTRELGMKLLWLMRLPVNPRSQAVRAALRRL